MSQKWGVVGYNDKRGHWYVKASGKVSTGIFGQIPVRDGRFLTCSNREMAEYLQDEISKEIDRGIFNPDK